MTSKTVVVTKTQGKKKKKSKQQNSPYGDGTVPKAYAAIALKGQVYRFKFTVDSNDISQIAIAETKGGVYYALTSYPGYSQFALFDEYRIECIKVKFRPRFNMFTIGSVGTNKLPRLYTVIDYDDASTPTDINALKQYQSCRECNFDQSMVRTFRPKCAAALYSGTFASYGNMDHMWIDMASPGVQHYGLKYGIEGGASGQTNLQSWSIESTYYVACRDKF
jgi:hypothetical protein